MVTDYVTEISYLNDVVFVIDVVIMGSDGDYDVGGLGVAVNVI